MTESTPSKPHLLRPSFALIEALVAYAHHIPPHVPPLPSLPKAQKRDEIHQASRKGVQGR